ncbi:MAG: glycosyltransferase, partial [Candidatus Aenigmarchaeota archaeon]|nr:glycosyltransferase [Candidatus Aenigmarchaeota archaeon]
MSRLSPEQRKELVKRVLEKGDSVGKVCQEFSISRVAFYKWKERYEESLKGKKSESFDDKPRELNKEFAKDQKRKEKEVLKIILKDPKLSCQQISINLPKDNNSKPILGNFGVQKILERLNLNTYPKRLIYSQKIKKTEVTTKPLRKEKFIKKKDKPLDEIQREQILKAVEERKDQKLSSKERLIVLEEVLKYNRPVKKVCENYRISRVIFYRWKERYLKALPDKRLKALEDRVLEEHPRKATKEQEKAVVQVVLNNPSLSSHKISEYLEKTYGRTILSNHGVQNILTRLGINTYEKRLAFQASHLSQPKIAKYPSSWEEFTDKLGIILDDFKKISSDRILKKFFLRLESVFLLSLVSLGLLAVLVSFIRLLITTPAGARVGLFFAGISLFFGMIFFIYSLKYYLILAAVLGFSRHIGNGNSNNGNGNGKRRHSILSRLFGNNNNHHSQDQTLLEKDLDRVALKRQPFVSIHIPFYNEKKVASRILTACTSMDYDNYEVIVVDDSNDETTQILEKWKKHKKVKIFHRDHRTGFKGGALRQAVAHMNPLTEFVIVFDADFIPYPDTIKLFLKYFNVVNGHSEDY